MNASVDFMVFRLKDFFKENSAVYQLDMVFLYGSFSRGQARTDSDIDLAVLFSRQLQDSGKTFDQLTDITYRLSCQLNKEINVISIERDFPRPMLYYNAIVRGALIFVKDYDEFLRLKLEALYQMEDFQIYAAGWQKEIARKLLREVFYG